MGRIQIEWKETTQMVADGMTKALAKAKFSNFVSQLGLQDIRERLSTVKKMEELREQIKLAQKGEQELDLEIKTGGRSIKKQ